LHIEQRLLVHARNVPVVFDAGFFVVGGALEFWIKREVQETQVRGIKVSLHGLKPVASPLVSQSAATLGFHHGPAQLRQRWRVFPIRSHVSPDDAVPFDAGIGGDADLLIELASWRFIRNVHAPTLNVKFPSVIEATQPVILITSEKQRGAAMRTSVINQSDLAVGVSESNQALAQQPHPQRRPVVLRQIRCLENRNPILPQEVAHGRPRADAGEKLVFGFGKHGFIFGELFLRCQIYHSLVAP
jgi:hypothetical protein